MPAALEVFFYNSNLLLYCKLFMTPPAIPNAYGEGFTRLHGYVILLNLKIMLLMAKHSSYSGNARSYSQLFLNKLAILFLIIGIQVFTEFVKSNPADVLIKGQSLSSLNMQKMLEY